MSPAMHTDQVAAAYERWAPVYDLVFGPVFRRGRSAAARAANRVGGRILEVGIGTGLSLPSYSGAARVYGIDISEGMLEKARRRAGSACAAEVEAIEVMDAERLDFADAVFDVVVAQYVVSAVPHPERALDEFARVLRPGGEIVITTRLGADEGFRHGIEKALMPVTSRLGFRTDFPWSLYGDWLARRADVVLLERRPLPPLGHFALLRLGKVDPAARAAA